jgi:hypothetical protein
MQKQRGERIAIAVILAVSRPAVQDQSEWQIEWQTALVAVKKT